MKALGILPAFEGWAVHDCWQSYFAFDNCQHALCNAHILRDLLFIVEQYEQNWAEKMIKLLLDIKAEVKATHIDQMSLSPERLTHFDQCYDKLISQGLAANPPPADPPPAAIRSGSIPSRFALARTHRTTDLASEIHWGTFTP